MSAALQVAAERGDGRLCLRLSGDCTIYTAAALHAALLEARADGDLELDMSAVQSCDSAGLQLLLHAARHRPLRVLGASAALRDLAALYRCGAMLGLEAP
jgi:anti-anti-sigma factor